MHSRPQSLSQRLATTDIQLKQEEVDLWKLRCKFLAEKYFNIVKDMKLNLQHLKTETQEKIGEMRQEMFGHFVELLKQ